MNAQPDVLLVEDDPDVQAMLVQVLNLEGYSTATADDGRQALDYLHQGNRPALILLDLMMPGMNGWQFRAAQMADPALAPIPVVVLSADNTAVQKAFDLGVQLGLRKPVDVSELITVIDRYRAAHPEGAPA